MSRFWVLLATMAVTTASHAKDCEQAPDYREMVDCHAREARETNAKVVEAYDLLLKRLGTSQAADKLRHSQKAWLEYQSNYCAFIAAANEGGSIVQLTRAQCYATTAKPRLRELEYQVDCQEGWFGCFRQR